MQNLFTVQIYNKNIKSENIVNLFLCRIDLLHNKMKNKQKGLLIRSISLFV